jgi:glycerol-3-phosphate acyltransferase PlsY
MIDIIIHILTIVVAYLLGSIPFGLIVARLFGVSDIREHGSGNIGATNVSRVLGFKAAVWVYLGDIGKGLVSVLIARMVVNNFGWPFASAELFYSIAALAAVLGHMFSIFCRFKGGKGVNTALGGLLALIPYEALMAFVVFLIVVLLSRFISLGSLIAGLSLFAIVAVEYLILKTGIAPTYFWLTAVLALLIIVAHRSNIARLIKGTENRVSLKSKESGVSPHA